MDLRLRSCASIATVAAATLLALALPSRIARAQSLPSPFGLAQNQGGPSSLATSSSQGVPASLAGVDLATGEARASFSFSLLTARGSAQPSLGLSYSSAAGVGYAGMGWTLDMPTIERRGASGAPRFDSDVLGASPDRSSDRYVFAGLPLVPICTLTNGTCAVRVQDEQFPSSLDGWTYFRGEIDDGERFFYSPTGETWIVQSKTGVTSTFGVLDSPLVGGANAIERGHEPLAPLPAGSTAPRNPTAALAVYRWNLAEQQDASGNAVYYGWQRFEVDVASGVDPAKDQGREYLVDIYDTLDPSYGPRLNGPTPSAVSAFAHHVHLTWNFDGGIPALRAQSPSWQTTPALFLDRVDVTSAPFAGGPRQIVRRYWLHYGPFGAASTMYQLASIDLEGSCKAWTEDPTGLLPVSTGCPRLPALAMTYLASQPGEACVVGDGEGCSFGDADPEGPQIVVDLAGSGTPQVYNNAGFAQPPPGGVPRYALGDWLADGRIDVLQLSINGGPSLDQNFYQVLGAAPGVLGQGQTPLTKYGTLLEPDFQATRAIDLDGDGLTDMGFVPEHEMLTNLKGYFSTRDALGNIRPVAQASASDFCATPAMMGALTTFYEHPAIRLLADVDGDGLSDIVVVENVVNSTGSAFGEAVAHVFKNRGDGRFGGGATGMPSCSEFASEPYDIDILTGGGIDDQAFQSAGTSLHDVDGDGLADFVWLDQNGLWVVLQTWDPQTQHYAINGTTVHIAAADLGCVKSTSETGVNNVSYDPNQALVLFGDFMGTGVDAIQAYTCGSEFTLALEGALGGGYNAYPVRPGLLQTISNGVGVTSSISYTNYLNAPSPPTARVPLPVLLVSQVETTNGLQGPDARDTVVKYAYDSPVYDARDRAFLGFQTVTATQAGDASGPGLDTVTHFALGTCSVVGGRGCDPTADYGFRLQRGLAAAIEQKDDATQATVSTTVNTYSYETIIPGTDGRMIRQLYVSQEDAYQWDETKPASTITSIPVLRDVSQPATHRFDLSISVSLPAASGHTRRAYHLDPEGNRDSVIDYGNPDGPSPDQPIAVKAVWAPVAGNATGFAYRLLQTRTGYLDASGSLVAPVREADYGYDGRGLVTSFSAPLSGTLPLLRSNPGGGTAPTPGDASHDTSAPVTLLSLTYDPVLGNLTQVTGPSGQCTQIGYDRIFAQLPVKTEQFPNGCGSAPLTTSRAYDRGFERVTVEVSPDNHTTGATYDAFGRLTAAYGSDASSPLVIDQAALLKVDYSKYDPPAPSAFPSSPPAPPQAFPLRVLAVSRNVGSPGQPLYETLWRYFDGAGAQILAVQQSENAGQVVVQGASVVGSATGRPVHAWRPFFASLPDGSAYDVQGGAPQGASTSAVYDALGRTTSSTDELGRQSKVTFLPANFAAQVRDAEQVMGTHTQAYSTVQYDGHGRLRSTIAHVASPATDDITTSLTYQATGEVTMLTRSHSAAGGGTYSRTMQYDSRGRMVSNTEPNTSVELLRSGAGGAPRDWRYAYNASGGLVGTSDARGCGENFQYDALGRVLGEDYSPCDVTTQAPYSTGDYATGTGLEAVYRYDTPAVVDAHAAFYRGHLTAVRDRGEHTRLKLDGRGRATAIDRQIGDLASFAGENDSYAPHVFQRQFVYDEANRVVRATTGADVAELLPGSTIDTTYTRRGGVSTVQMPYSTGRLLAQRTFDASNAPLTEAFGNATLLRQSVSYYPNETLKELQTIAPQLVAPVGSSPVIQDLNIVYDDVDNPLSVNDTSQAKWPAGILPAKRATTYDDLYRLTSVATTYGPGDGTDAFTSPYLAETQAGSLAFPAIALPPTRVTGQSFGYDFLDNILTSTDDQSVAPDRSFGQGTYGGSTFNPEPNHLVSTSENGTTTAVSYDAAGNTTGVTVASPTAVRDGPPCANGAAPPCTTRYAYVWDEVGRLQSATRYDGAPDPTANASAAVTLAYLYDASGARVARSETHAQVGGTAVTSYAVSVFPSLRLDASELDSSGDYERTSESEIVYLQDGAGASYGRAFYAAGSASSAGGAVHVYVELGDHLGSTTAVVDFDSGQVVEKSSYLAYGAVDADYRPEATGSFREPYRYTGHQDDSEVGLVYFGARYYLPTLGRWASPDPVTIHGLGASLNPYAFVGGSPLGRIDPFGLQDESPPSPEPLTGDPGSVVPGGYQWGYGSGGGSAGTLGPPHFYPAAVPPSPYFTYRLWSPAGSGFFELHNPGPSPDWATRLHTSAQAWRGVANGALDFLASTTRLLGLAGGPTGYFLFADVANAIPRFQLDPKDEGPSLQATTSVALGVLVAVASGGESIAGESLEVGGAKAAEQMLGGTGRVVALDTNAFKSLTALRTQGVVSSSDALMVSPNVAEELLRHGIGSADLAKAGVSVADASPTGASVAAARIAEVLRGFGGVGAKSAAADALNVAEAVGLRADAFVTRDRQILRAFGGFSTVPGTGGSSIVVLGF